MVRGIVPHNLLNQSKNNTKIEPNKDVPSINSVKSIKRVNPRRINHSTSLYSVFMNFNTIDNLTWTNIKDNINDFELIDTSNYSFKNAVKDLNICIDYDFFISKLNSTVNKLISDNRDYSYKNESMPYDRNKINNKPDLILNLKFYYNEIININYYLYYYKDYNALIIGIYYCIMLKMYIEYLTFKTSQFKYTILIVSQNTYKDLSDLDEIREQFTYIINTLKAQSILIEIKNSNRDYNFICGGKSKSNYKKTENKITVLFNKKKYTRVIYICERKKYVKINKTFMLLSKLKKV
jgi:hypothetical protein